MLFKVLGCSGSETQESKTSCYLLGEETLFDAGCAASTLSLAEQRKIRQIFLTHAHLDHIKDLAFLAENIYGTVNQPIQLYGTAGVLQAVQQHLFNGVIWPDFTRLPSVEKPLFAPVTIAPGSETRLGNLRIQAVAVNHAGPAIAYIIGGKQEALVYSGDTGPTEELWQRVNSQAEISTIILETSWPNRLVSLAGEARHLTVGLLAEELKKIQRHDVKIFVCHIKSPFHDETLAELETLGDRRLHVLVRGDTFALA